MKNVTIYTSPVCPYCINAKNLLKQVGADNITEIDRDSNMEAFQQVMAQTGQRTVPQIFIGDTHVGGFTDLAALHKAGKLIPMLQAE